MKTKAKRLCPRCEGKGTYKPPYFSTALEECKECRGSGQVEVEVDAKRRYVCDTCRHGFEAGFTIEPKELGELTRCCPSCGAVGFVVLETTGDIVRVWSCLGDRE